MFIFLYRTTRIVPLQPMQPLSMYSKGVYVTESMFGLPGMHAGASKYSVNINPSESWDIYPW